MYISAKRKPVCERLAWLRNENNMKAISLKKSETQGNLEICAA